MRQGLLLLFDTRKCEPGAAQGGGEHLELEVWILRCLKQTFQLCKFVSSSFCFCLGQAKLSCRHLQFTKLILCTAIKPIV